MRYIFVLVLLISFKINLDAQKVLVDKSGLFYQISSIYDFKQSIVSLTFDDGYSNQFYIGIPILKERNIPATFYVVTDWIDLKTISFLVNNISEDYEIGSHTITHPDLAKVDNSVANKELLDSKSFIQNNFGINSGLTMSYPFGIYNNYVKQLAKNIYLAARSTKVGYNSSSTLDKYALKIQSFGKQTEANRANLWVDHAIENHLWLIEMIHGINDVGYSPVDSKVLIEHLDYIKARNDKIWCSTVSNVIKYIDESKNAKIECDLCNDTVFKIRINDFMDDYIFDRLLSIRIKVPDNWDSIWISNNEKVRTEYYNNAKFILFNALPDNQLLTIRPRLISVPDKDSGIRLIYLSANPFYDELRLSLEALDQKDIDIVLFDMNGKLLIHHEEKAVNGLINLFFDTSGISNGVYFLRVSIDGRYYILKKLIKIYL
jgi:peptidoglycan/xylan/chitin deacetylase (PgdA/CDA1 family)